MSHPAAPYTTRRSPLSPQAGWPTTEPAALPAATQELLDSYRQELLVHAAKMDNAGGSYTAYRSAQADWCATRDIIQNLRTAHLNPAEIIAAEAQEAERQAAHYYAANT